jgi:hypothetical protein
MMVFVAHVQYPGIDASSRLRADGITPSRAALCKVGIGRDSSRRGIRCVTGLTLCGVV